MILIRAAVDERCFAGELAIDDAGFTPDFFRQKDNIRDLFDGEEMGEGVDEIEDAPLNQAQLNKVRESI